MKTKTETVDIPWMGGFLRLPKLNGPTETKTRPIHDGVKYTQSCIDEEWERWEKDATLEWERKIL